VASPAMGHWGTCPPLDFKNIIFSSLWSKSGSQLSKYCVVWDQLMQMSTTHSSFDQYCISHKTISHRAAAALGPEAVLFLWRYEPVRRTGKSDDWLTIFAHIIRLTVQKFEKNAVVIRFLFFFWNFNSLLII